MSTIKSTCEPHAFVSLRNASHPAGLSERAIVGAALSGQIASATREPCLFRRLDVLAVGQSIREVVPVQESKSHSLRQSPQTSVILPAMGHGHDRACW